MPLDQFISLGVLQVFAHHLGHQLIEGGFQNAQRAEAIGVGGVFGRLKTHSDMALRCKIVYFVRLRLLDDTDEVSGIRQVVVMQDEIAVRDMRILVEVVNPVRVEERGTALDAMHLVALFEQEFGKVGAVLTGNPGYQSFLHYYPML